MAESDNHEELSSDISRSSEEEGAGEGEGEDRPERAGEGEDRPERAGEGGHEEELYTLLFCKVDSDGSGQVAVDSLVDYLRHMQMGTPQNRGTGREEVYDSQEDVHQVQYNLQLLKAMLEVSAVEGRVDQATYSRVIRLWVKDVRERSNQQATALEVSQLSDSEEDGDGVAMAMSKPPLSFVAEESFETSGGNSSNHSALDRLDLLTSLQDVRLDNRRLAERERQLQTSLDVSEEHLRTLQAENSSLQHQLHSVQQQLMRLEEVERDNTVIGQSLKEEGQKCGELTGAVEKMRQQLYEAQGEVAALRHRISEREMEREQAYKDAEDLQQQMLAKQEALDKERERCAAIQVQLSNMATTEETLRSKVMELEESNTRLQSENVELHSVAVATGPSSSTPSRATERPSLHEELSRHGNLSGQALPSPLVGLQSHHHDNKRESCRLEDHYDNSLSRSPGNLSMEDLEQMAQSSSNKFHSKTEVMVRLLSELLNSSRPPHTSSSPTSRSSESVTEVGQRRQLRDSNLKQLVASVKKLYGEKKQLRQQVAELQDQLQQKRMMKEEEVDAAVQTTPPPLKTKTVDTATQAHIPYTSPTPSRLPYTSPTPSRLSTCFGVVGGVMRGVVWALLLVMVVFLLLTVLVNFLERLTPCHGYCLSPGSMIWAVVQPHISVTRNGYI